MVRPPRAPSPRAVQPRPLVTIVLLALVAGCQDRIKVAGSSCATDTDCLDYSSCAYRPGACTCSGGACWLDPNAPAVETGCRGCHGSLDGPAPPAALSGATSTTDIGVGAHQQHLRGSDLAGPVACDECHVVPENVSDPGHIDGDNIAEVTFGPIATGGGSLALARWDRDSATCVTYCHGATLLGGTTPIPVWTQVDGTQAACGSCHGLPPGGDHPQIDRCELCHAPTAGPNLTIANPATHIDGIVQGGVPQCGTCHGTPDNPAPPPSTTGATDTTDVAVGAHAAHLTDSAIRLAVDCSECHVVPAAVDSPGHLDGIVTVTWGPLATTGGVTPAWDHDSATCGNTYCHGSFPGGNAGNRPIWTQVDGTQAACGSCHGDPPPPPHPQALSCSTCHPDTVTPWGDIDVVGGRHINGVVDVVDQSCTSCHGDPASGSPAPPRGTHGETQPTEPAVGAHGPHLTQSSWHRQVQCSDCHVVPVSMGHSDGVAQVTFGGPAGAGGASPQYDGGALTCSGVYCHGATLLPARAGGVVNRTPLWTQVDGTFNACGSSCHTNPPGGSHPQVGQCSSCHGDVIDAAGNIIAPERHIDGTVDVTAVACDSCHGSAGNPAPPVSTTGATATTDVTVGAHASHLTDNLYRKAIACDECHVVPTSVDQPGHLDPSPAEVVFGPLSRTSGAAPAWNRSTAKCAGTYCHGATLTGATNATPTWTVVNGSQVSCTSCHGNPPPVPHPQTGACNTCHPQTVTTAGTIDVAGGHHIDGHVDVVGSTCTTCHGNAATGQSAPPLGTQGETATTTRAVGAHAAHLVASTWHRPGQCVDCHPVPSSTTHSNGVVDMVFSTPADADGATPQYTSSTGVCANYCHGSTLGPAASGGTLRRAPVWTKVDGSFSACGASCHTNPPGGTHPQSSQCAACHGAVITAGGTFANPALHINGTVEVTTPSCNACHGGATNAAPPLATTGASTTADVRVGAHQSHLADGPMRQAVACGECHVVPTSVDQAGHLDPSPAEVTFGPLAQTGGAVPAWNRTAATCGDTYCHGATLGGGSNTVPTWTTVNGTQAACGTCHGNPPPAPHPQMAQCHQCHAATVTAAGAIDVAGGKHINGTVEATGVHPDSSIWDTPGSGDFHGDAANQGLAACTSCHGSDLNGGASGVSCNQCHSGWRTNCTFCHGGTDNATGAPPKSVAGATATTTIGVGAHTSHVSARHGIAAAQPCTSCHVVPADALSAGHIDPAPAEVTFGPLARTGGVSPTWTHSTASCALTYCHGNFTGGVTTNAPVWTTVDGSNVACTRCHGIAPSTGQHSRHRSYGCDACHNTIANSGGTAIVTPTLHVNGVKDVIFKNGGTWTASTRRCTPSCHGTETW